MEKYEYEVVWHGALQRKGSHTKGELLGDYRTSVMSETDPFLNRKIRDKINAGRKAIRKDDDGE